MGAGRVPAKLESLEDVMRLRRGELEEAAVRTVTVPDALVDTGAVMLSLPRRIVKQLGLRPFRTRRTRTVAGVVDIPICEAVRLTVMDRDCTIDVAEVPDDCPVLIGQIPLELLDFVVDPNGQKLIGNPEHGGEHMLDMF
jgi:predicted aspartyl protease